MAYFPFFAELAERRALIVGGGRTALGKARRLADYGAALTVVAPEVLPELAALPGITVLRRRFSPEDLLEDWFFVIAATDDGPLNREISEGCRGRRIPVNVVDTPEACDFFFPSLVRRGPLSIGISTGGASPTAAIQIRREVEAMLPDCLGDILLWLGELRPEIRAQTDGEEPRKRIYQKLYARAVALGRPLSREETETLIREVKDA